MSGRRFPLVTRVLPVAVIATVVLVALVPAGLELVGRGDRAASMGGDFASFYAAGEIVLDGRIDDLYRASVQQEYQADFHGDGEFLYFAYPPYVAVAYAVIAWMPFGVAFSVHALLGIAAMIAAAWLAVPHVFPGVSRTRHVAAASALAIVAYPFFRAILGGQNTTFTLVFLTGVWWAMDRGRWVLAGALLASLGFKPQFALVILAYLGVSRAWRVVGVGLGIGGAVYLVTAARLGMSWPSQWLDAAMEFGDANDAVNGPLMVNVVGWAGAALPDGAVSSAFVLVCFGAVAATAGAVAWTVGTRWGAIGVVAAALVLLSPSTLYYDAGVALFAVGVIGAMLFRDATVGIVFAAVSWVQLAQEPLGWSPLFLIVVASLVVSMGVWRRSENVSHPAGTLAALADADGGENTWRVTG